MLGQLKPSDISLFDFGPLVHGYDRWYATPVGQAQDRLQKQDVRRLLRSSRTGEKLLDVGCGTAHWSSFFAEMGYQVTGVDLSPEMTKAARSAVPECSFQVADACGLPFADASFGVVASMTTLEYIPDPTAAVQEMVRCAKPGGSLLIGTLNRLAPLNRDRLSKGEQPYASAHLFSPAELRSLLAPVGSVRMIASSADERTGPFLPAGNAPSNPPVREVELQGPLIVAMVSR
jgi:SAM-dependent methyltransferase